MSVSQSNEEIEMQSNVPCNSLTWVHKAVPRKDETRTNTHHGRQGTNKIMIYVKKYCKSNNIIFNKKYSILVVKIKHSQ